MRAGGRKISHPPIEALDFTLQQEGGHFVFHLGLDCSSGVAQIDRGSNVDDRGGGLLLSNATTFLVSSSHLVHMSGLLLGGEISDGIPMIATRTASFAS